MSLRLILKGSSTVKTLQTPPSLFMTPVERREEELTCDDVVFDHFVTRELGVGRTVKVVEEWQSTTNSDPHSVLWKLLKDRVFNFVD